MKTLFRWIWRFNALAIAGGAVVAMALGAWLFAGPVWEQLAFRGGTAASASSGERTVANRLEFGGFRWLDKDKTLWAHVRASARPAQTRVSYKRSKLVRNYVFVDLTTGENRTLLPKSSAVISDVRVLRVGDAAEGTPLALVITLAEKDTNQDGFIGRGDQSAVALAKGDGTGLKRLGLAGRVLSAERARAPGAEGMAALIVKGRNGALELVSVDLTTFEIRMRQPIPVS